MDRKRRVMIGTPSYDGRIDVWYVNSIINTVKIANDMNVEIVPMWVSYDALIQRARNDTMALAREMNCDDLVFIDADIEWRPEHFYRLLNYPVDIVGGTYRKKGEAELYVGKIPDPTAARDPITNLLRVDGLGTGFLRFSRRVIDAVWEVSKPYHDPDKGDRRWIFDVVVEDNQMISEDIWLCKRLLELGFPTWLDTDITCNHIGFKKYTGDFANFISQMGTMSPVTTPQQAPILPENIKSLYE